jgi:hypothetical protein
VDEVIPNIVFQLLLLQRYVLFLFILNINKLFIHETQISRTARRDENHEFAMKFAS